MTREVTLEDSATLLGELDYPLDRDRAAETDPQADAGRGADTQ